MAYTETGMVKNAAAYASPSTSIDAYAGTGQYSSGTTIVIGVVCDNLSATTPTITSISKAANETANWVQLGSWEANPSTSLGAVRGFLWAIKTTVDWGPNNGGGVVTLSDTITIRTYVCKAYAPAGGFLELRQAASTGNGDNPTAAGQSIVAGDLVIALAGTENSAQPTVEIVGLTDWDYQGANTSGGGGSANGGIGMWSHVYTGFASHGIISSVVSDGGVILAVLKGSVAVSASRSTTWNTIGPPFSDEDASFEGGTTGTWTNLVDGSLSPAVLTNSTTQAAVGTHSMRLDTGAGASINVGAHLVAYGLPNTAYTVTIAVYLTTGTFGVVINPRHSDGGVISGSTSGSTTTRNQWVDIVATFTTDSSGVVHLNVKVNTGPDQLTGQFWYVDNLRMVSGQPVSASRATTWHTKAQVQASRQTTWAVNETLTPVSASRLTTWHTRAQVEASRQTTWTVAGQVQASRLTTWEVRYALSVERNTTWTVSAAITAARQTFWTTSFAVSTSRATTWDVEVLLGTPVLSGVAVSQTQIDLSWTSVATATGYDIERDSTVIVTDHATLAYSDTVGAGTTHTYRVRAVVSG